MKKLLSLVLVTLLMILSLTVTAFATDDEICVYLDGIEIEFDVKPQVINGRTMVPIRAIFEKMGAHVSWNADTNTAVCTKDSTIVKMTVNSNLIYINDAATTMDTTPVVVTGRTLAPARYVAEAFGATVKWVEEHNAVVISTTPNAPMPTFNKVTLYALDGRTKKVSPNEVDAYLKVGWYKTLAETQTTVYALDGRTKTIYKSEVDAYLKVGWYKTLAETQTTVYANDGRTKTIYKSEVDAYLKVGWYKTLAETQTTVYAPDGRTKTIYKDEVNDYINVGWYKTASEAQNANKPKQETTTKYNSGADGYYYRTPTGKKYHLDPDCGGKNSYRTNNISGLSPCKKCA